MARKIYKRFGLRRDQNFGDLPDARSALNNLLDGLVTVGGDTFVSEDLDPIRNINNIGLNNSQYRLIVGTTTKYTPSSGGANRNFIPHITFQNRFDKFTVFSGVPRIAGGNGPSASYWQKDQIVVNSENSSDDTERKFEYDQDTNSPASEVLAGITTFGALPSDNVWEKGNFTYTGKVHPQSVLTDGGVTWEGYFVPTITGPHTFTITSTGYTTFDFNRSDYEEDDNKNQTPTSEQIQIDAGVGKTNKKSRGRSTKVSFIHNDFLNSVIRDLVIFNYDYEITEAEDLQFAAYNVGDFYVLHKDVDEENNRVLSVTVQLSKPSEYEGGDLVFDYDRHPMEKTRGTIIIFPSNLYHEVTPVTKGERYSLVQWFKGQKIKKEKK